MRIFNGTKSYLDLPITGIQRIQVPPHSVSQDFMPSTEFLSLLVGSYDYSEVALIVAGPYEINMCAGVSGSVGFVVQSLEEAIERFTPKTPEVVVVEEKPKEVIEEVGKNPREGWAEKFEEYAKEGEDEQIIPDHIDSEALEIADSEDKKEKKEEKKKSKKSPRRRWEKEDEKKAE